MKVVGLESVKNEMDRIKAQSEAYRKGGAKVPNIVMNISKENGQSYVANYITSVLYEYKVRRVCFSHYNILLYIYILQDSEKENYCPIFRLPLLIFQIKETKAYQIIPKASKIIKFPIFVIFGRT